MLLDNIPPLPERDNTLRYLAGALPVCYSDATGMAHYLDGTTPLLTVYEPVRNLTSLYFYCRSASAVTGNIVLEVLLDDIVKQRLIVAVDTVETGHRINFPTPGVGRLSLRRNVADAADTLRDGDVVTAIVSVDLLLEENLQ